LQSQKAAYVDTTKIVKESQKRIKKALVEGFEYDHLVVSKSDKFLRRHVFQRMDFPVIYVDIIGSTVLGVELTPDFLSKIITVFSQEAAYVFERFGGLVLKFIGDSVIGYFPCANDQKNNNIDHIVSCGKSLVHVVREAINPLLLQMGHNGIEIKVTSDYGIHTIVRYGSDPEQSHVDIISTTMNIAAKMQFAAKGGQMVIGKRLYERLSDDLQKIFVKDKVGKKKWNYQISSKQQPYQLYITTF
jgi:adenylate cyclase